MTTDCRPGPDHSSHSTPATLWHPVAVEPHCDSAPIASDRPSAPDSVQQDRGDATASFINFLPAKFNLIASRWCQGTIL